MARPAQGGVDPDQREDHRDRADADQCEPAPAQRPGAQPGDAIIYPADTLHRVAPVTRGVRDVAVFWIQSLVRDAGRRRILYDIRSALDVLDRSPEPPPHVEALRRSYFNLIRMWV